MTDLASLVVRMQADNSQYIKALDQANSRLQHFAHQQEEEFDQLKEGFAKLGETLIEAFAVEKIVEFGVSTIESLASLDKMSQSAGIAVEELSSLRLAFAAGGVSQEEMGVALKKLNVSLSEAAGSATSKAGVAFRALGIEVKNSDGSLKSLDKLLPEIATKFKDSADGPNKVAIAVALMGKAGQQMIPVLNEGADGLDKIRKSAEDAGLVIDEKLAKSAEEASRKFIILKTQIVDGFGAQLASRLLPSLNDFEDALSKGAGKMEFLGNAADVVVGILKTMVVVPTVILGSLAALGDALNGIGKAFYDLGTLNFLKNGSDLTDGLSAAWQRLKSTFGFAHDTVMAGLKDEKKGVDELAEAVNEHAKLELPSIKGIEEIDKADAKLKAFSEGLKEQVLAFGLGGAAAVKFKLQTGQLADDFKNASAEGKKAAAAAIEYAVALETKKDTKTVTNYTDNLVKQITALEAGSLAQENYALHSGALGEALDRLGKKGDAYRESIMKAKAILVDDQDAKAVQALSDKSDVLAGRLNKAALAAFDLQYRLLKTNLTAAGDQQGLEQLATERAHIDALSKINELNLHAAEIQTDLATAESKISLARAQGQISDIQAGNQEAAVRSHAIDQLDQIYAREKDIAAGANDPALVDGVKKFGVQIDGLKVQMTQFDSQVRQGLEGAFAHNFADLINGAKSFKQAILGFLQDIDKQFVDMIAKDYAQKLFAGASGSSSGGALGGLSGLLGGLLGGGGAATSVAATGAGAVGGDTGALASTIIPAFASGGTLDAGKVGMVGESGPEYVYSGSQNMNVVPAGGGKQVSVTNHFTIQAPGGTISRASQMQTAAAAARSLSQANRRNNT